MELLKEARSRDIYRLTAEITLEYDTESMSKNVFQSINVDNYQYIKCNHSGKVIRCEAKSDKIGSLLHTIDDFLACVIIAENVYHSI